MKHTVKLFCADREVKDEKGTLHFIQMYWIEGVRGTGEDFKIKLLTIWDDGSVASVTYHEGAHLTDVYSPRFDSKKYNGCKRVWGAGFGKPEYDLAVKAMQAANDNEDGNPENGFVTRGFGRLP